MYPLTTLSPVYLGAISAVQTVAKAFKEILGESKYAINAGIVKVCWIVGRTFATQKTTAKPLC